MLDNTSLCIDCIDYAVESCKITVFVFGYMIQSLYVAETGITLYTVDATKFVAAQIDATFHEGRGKWRTVS